MSKAEYMLRGQYASGAPRAKPAIRYDSANGIELYGSYRSDLLCARDWTGRSSADALPHRIRMHEARRNPSPPGYKKHTPLGKPHARRILCRQTENRSRALLGSASCLVSFERKAIAFDESIGLLNWHERTGSPSRHPKAFTLSEQPRSCGMSNWKHWRYRL